MFPGRRSLLDPLRTRVELHAHLDGCVRHETAWELLKQKGLPLPGDGSFHALQEALTIRDPKDLGHFLAPFAIFSPAIAGDLEAIERVAFEFCEDRAQWGVLYVEARYTPHLWTGLKDYVGKVEEAGRVVQAVQRGFERAEQRLGIRVRSILCALNGLPEGCIASDILQLCRRFQGHVVAMDTAACPSVEGRPYEEVPLVPEALKAYEDARAAGLHRTMHAGEAGGADMVRRAVERYNTERVGHGYRVLEDEAVYEDCRRRGILFECCPWSSLLTGAVSPTVAKHPIVRFAEDDANFSLSTDDTALTGLTLHDDYALAASWGLTEAHLVRTNLNAARSCFLPAAEKAQLQTDLLRALGAAQAQ